MSNEHARTLITGGRVLRLDGDPHAPAVADIVVEGNRISAVGPGLAAGFGEPGPKDRIIDADGMLVVPGFVNAHYHSHDVLLKGCFETIPLEVWVLSALPPAYPQRSPEEVRARTLLGAFECLRSGITTVQDMLTITPLDEGLAETALAAYRDIGLRAAFSLQVGDVPALDGVPFWREVIPEAHHGDLNASVKPSDSGDDPLDRIADLIRRLPEPGPRVTWALGPTSPEFCSPGMLERIAALSAEHELPVLTHVYESKPMAVAGRKSFADLDGSQIRFLQSVGLTGPRLSLAHSVWMRSDEIDLIAETGTNVVLNPVGNLKTKSGVPPIRKYLTAGVNVGLGCDNCSCGDAQNMFQAMKLFGGLAAVSHSEPGPPDATDCIHAATRGGAAALGLGGEVGDLAPGMKADLTLLALDEPSFVPLNSAARQMVYAEGGSAVRTVLVDGEVLMEDRRLVRVDEDELRDAVEIAMGTLRRDIEAIRERVGTIHPYLLEAWRRAWNVDIGVERYVGDGTG